MANEANVAGELFVDKGDGWRHFDARVLGATVGPDHSGSKLPANTAQNTNNGKKK